MNDWAGIEPALLISGPEVAISTPPRIKHQPNCHLHCVATVIDVLARVGLLTSTMQSEFPPGRPGARCDHGGKHRGMGGQQYGDVNFR